VRGFHRSSIKAGGKTACQETAHLLASLPSQKLCCMLVTTDKRGSLAAREMGEDTHPRTRPFVRDPVSCIPASKMAMTKPFSRTSLNRLQKPVYTSLCDIFIDSSSIEYMGTKSNAIKQNKWRSEPKRLSDTCPERWKSLWEVSHILPIINQHQSSMLKHGTNFIQWLQ
jgi:hypothetical protein